MARLRRWQLHAAGFTEAYGLMANMTPTRTIRVGVIDSGVDLEHPHLMPYLGEGYLSNNSLFGLRDINGHGTEITGIIVSTLRNCPNIKFTIHPVKAFGQDGHGNYSTLARSLHWCAEHQMDIVNMSFGLDRGYSREVAAATRVLYDDGAILIGASGNDGAGVCNPPAEHPWVLGVAATVRSGRLARFSNYGDGVNITAPGVDILTSTLQRKPTRIQGTSASVAYVTAASVMLKSACPTLTNQDVYDILKDSASHHSTGRKNPASLPALRVDNALHGLQSVFNRQSAHVSGVKS